MAVTVSSARWPKEGLAPQHDPAHRSAVGVLDAGEQLRLPCPAAATVIMCLWLSSNGVRSMLNGRVLLPRLPDAARGITLALLNLHNDADEQEHCDRHHNWFWLIGDTQPSDAKPLAESPALA
jgi:hypothetical protein